MGRPESRPGRSRFDQTVRVVRHILDTDFVLGLVVFEIFARPEDTPISLAPS